MKGQITEIYLRGLRIIRLNVSLTKPAKSFSFTVSGNYNIPSSTWYKFIHNDFLPIRIIFYVRQADPEINEHNNIIVFMKALITCLSFDPASPSLSSRTSPSVLRKMFYKRQHQTLVNTFVNKCFIIINSFGSPL